MLLLRLKYSHSRQKDSNTGSNTLLHTAYIANFFFQAYLYGDEITKVLCLLGRYLRGCGIRI